MSEKCLQEFQQHGITRVPNVLDQNLCELICNYMRLKSAQRQKVRNGSDPLRGIHREYADPLFETLLQQLTPTIEDATGLNLWPTLSFCYHYVTGNSLRAHKDRVSCEIVAGLCIGADPEFVAHNGNWPLHINGRSMDVDFGDVVIFRGSQMQHWRDEFSGQWFVSAILGYVDKNGPYAYQKFDQRKQLGTKHVGMSAWYLGVLRAKLLAILAKYR